MIIVGIDEVGRGCWAGPLVAAAAILKFDVDGLTDSKLLTKKRRESLLPFIKAAAEWGVGWVEPDEVDNLGLTQSVRIAMQRAIDQISEPYDQIIIDGNYNYLSFDKRSETLIKADLLIPTVSAASIIAKVARDDYMQAMHLKYPGYGFDSNVGYGTALHVVGLDDLGVCPIHRRSYKPIKKYL